MNPVDNVAVLTSNDMIYTHIFIAIGVAIITAIITAYIAHIFARHRERENWKRTLKLQKIQDYNKAAAIFRSEFIETLYKLKTKGSSAYELLYRVCPQFEKAMMQFKPYLSDHEVKNLDAAWKEFAISKKYHPDDLLQYNAHNSDERDRLSELAIQRIKKILECAKPNLKQQ